MLVAQKDRALDCGSKGQKFKSFQACLDNKISNLLGAAFVA